MKLGNHPLKNKIFKTGRIRGVLSFELITDNSKLLFSLPFCLGLKIKNYLFNF
jgi:hypothetical protein